MKKWSKDLNGYSPKEDKTDGPTGTKVWSLSQKDGQSSGKCK